MRQSVATELCYSEGEAVGKSKLQENDQQPPPASSPGYLQVQSVPQHFQVTADVHRDNLNDDEIASVEHGMQTTYFYDNCYDIS